MKTINLLDTVANIKPISQERLTLIESEYSQLQNLPSGQVGTVVEIYKKADKYYYLVEFADNNGVEYAMAILQEDELLILHYELQIA
jgi:Domain of unknown function (DUF4926)